MVLYDGTCNFCEGAVRFIQARDPRGRFHFMALQSAPGRELLRACGLPDTRSPSLILVERGLPSQASTAVLRITRRLRGLWPLCAGLLLVPRPLRDAAYGAVARRRYRWFGRRDTCASSPNARGEAESAAAGGPAPGALR